MARIRNIKPEFFRHEALQDLEAAHPCAYIMLTYVALWTQCDKNGVFAWKPRIMALDILPFLGINIEQNLQILLDAGYIQTFENQETKYGYIPTFNRHQILPTKEKLAQSKYPNPPATEQGQSLHSPGTPEEGRRKKEEGERENAHAHEDENSTKKNPPITVTTKPEANSPSIGGGRGEAWSGGGATVTDIFAVIETHTNTDDGLRELISWKKQAGYSDRTHGPTTGEVTKFITKYLDRIRAGDPVQYFRDNFPAWLVRATEYNRPRKDAKPKYEPPQPHQRQRHNGNATPTTLSIGDIAGKIITEIAQ